jgi:hypothetical protein
MTAMALVLAAFPYPVDLLWNIFRCIQKTEKSDYYLHHVSPSICLWLPICMEQLADTIQILIKSDISEFLKNLSTKFKYH